MKNHIFTAVILAALILGINISAYAQNGTKKIVKKEIAQGAKKNVKEVLTTDLKAPQTETRMDIKNGNERKEVAKAAKKVGKKGMKKESATELKASKKEVDRKSVV